MKNSNISNSRTISGHSNFKFGSVAAISLIAFIALVSIVSNNSSLSED